MSTAGGHRARWDRAALWLRFYVGRSVSLDRATVALSRWPAGARAAFLASKTRALPRLQAGRPATVSVGAVRFTATSALDLGSLQSCLLDVHDELVLPGVLDDTPAPVVLDVGANVGQFLTAIKAFYPAASVLSVEPDPETHEKLATNAAPMPGVTTRCVAVGEARGTLALHRHHVSLMSTLRPGAVEEYDPELTIDVEVMPLDELGSELPHVDLLKIDVEGFELEVLRGGREVLRRTRYLMLELGLGRQLDGANLEVLALVHELVPGARVVRFGRPLGSPADPICQDVLLELPAARRQPA